MIEVSRLTKRYGSRYAVRDVSFSLNKGDVVGFLGPNGAGKTTTLRILAGFLGCTAGTIVIAGHDLAREPLEARKKLGYMPEIVPLYSEMRVIEYLTFRAEIKGVPARMRRSFVWDAIEQAIIADVATTTIRKLSKGYKQRVGLADALVAKPPILILDEPTAGLDPNQIREVRAVVKELAIGHTVLLSTHLLSEVEASCTRALVIDRGQLRADGTVDDLKAMRHSFGLDLVVRGDAGRAEKILRELKGIVQVRQRERDGLGSQQVALRCVFANDGGEAELSPTAERAVAELVQAGFGVSDVRCHGGSLEDVFAALTRSGNDP